MKTTGLLAGCIGMLLCAPVQARAQDCGSSFGYGGHQGPCVFYGPYPAYVAPPGYHPPVYAYAVYYPGSVLGLRYYQPYRPPVYGIFIPKRRQREYYTPRRYYRRTAVPVQAPKSPAVSARKDDGSRISR